MEDRQVAYVRLLIEKNVTHKFSWAIKFYGYIPKALGMHKDIYNWFRGVRLSDSFI